MRTPVKLRLVKNDEEGGVRHTDPSTSHEAAASIDPKTLRERALKALVRHADWVTYFEWSRISGIPYSSITPRGKWLVDNGDVECEIFFGFNAQGVWKPLMHFRAKV